MKESMFQPLEKKRYFEQIAELIREKIHREGLQDGFKLPTELQLASDLDVGRSVVREAIRILDVMGYVSIRKGPQGGIFVSSLFHKPMSDSLRNLASTGRITVDHLFDVRLHIEPFIAEEAARNATKEDINRLIELIKDAELHSDDAAYLKQKNIEFHFLLAEASGNPVLAILMKSLIEILMEIAFNFLDPVFEKDLLHVHANLLEAITKKQIKDVGRLVKEDIIFVKNNLKRSIEKG